MKKVDILRPKTWVRYQPSLCQGCQAGCCTLPVLVTAEELYHLGYLKADEVNGPLKRIAQRLIRQGIIRSYQDRTRLFRLEQKNGHDCVFLDGNRRCVVYDRRPSICRQFPSNSARPGFCPSQRKE